MARKEERSMSSSGDRSILVLAILIAGCFQSHPCDPEERCNLRDDDCDGLVDEGIVGDDGVYRSIENCGECGLDCRAVFPTASEVACGGSIGEPSCEIVSCPIGFHLAGEGACVPDVPVLCLPCTTNDDCALRMPGAQCIETGSGQTRCTKP